MAKVPNLEVADAFQLALAELAGLDPSKVLAGTLTVSVDPGVNGATARVEARVSVPVDPDEVIRLSMLHQRISPRA